MTGYKTWTLVADFLERGRSVRMVDWTILIDFQTAGSHRLHNDSEEIFQNLYMLGPARKMWDSNGWRGWVTFDADQRVVVKGDHYRTMVKTFPWLFNKKGSKA